ncbi:hypothetical protein E4U41_001041 [Claviceps citrina]|nr:hypothetical protein E4U41_001041 [Claviceps citrina]
MNRRKTDQIPDMVREGREVNLAKVGPRGSTPGSPKAGGIQQIVLDDVIGDVSAATRCNHDQE